MQVKGLLNKEIDVEVSVDEVWKNLKDTVITKLGMNPHNGHEIVDNNWVEYIEATTTHTFTIDRNHGEASKEQKDILEALEKLQKFINPRISVTPIYKK
jgi:predicted DNA-binding transcriptional regulator|tara:strand:- start:288 stop:584 length:297 start_codon:yes stop_codon:yes gene_type:complete